MSTKLIRRALIASGIFIGAAVAFSPTAKAANTADVGLGGSVTSTVGIVTNNTTGTGLNLGGDGTTPTPHVVQVADFTMSTNNEQGLSLSVPVGTMTKTNGTTITYQVKVVDHLATAPEAVDFSSGDQTYTTNAAGPANRDLYINYTPANFQDPGAYTGSITLTVSDR
ncbi:MAG: hypothetical protein ACYTXT_22070 [Nostoc sp.]|uniref:DUF4402 domain-containing protein n=1 Tax=Nostoc punctiforme NIES-2108 TaxID=1356359 RepID=A0A367RUM7_NOSPU|nr:hypothetical protein A6769_06235 [Nostoc punctiforme NIES-2108]